MWVIFVDFVDAGHVGVIEGRRRPCLLNEAALAIRILKKVRRQDFQRDFALEAHVERTIDDAHPSPPHFVEDPVVREGTTNQCVRLRSHRERI